jgi:hypothetical protein
MSERVIRQGKRVHCHEFNLNFHIVGDEGACYSFECDEQGNVKTEGFAPIALENLAICQANVDGKYHPPVVKRYDWSYWQPAEMKCGCGMLIHLTDALDNECERCGKYYNMSGQEVIPSHKCDEQGNPYDYDY